MTNFVTQEEFYRRLNEAVFKPNFGRELSFNESRDVVHGVADVICQMALEGESVRLGRLGMFKVHVTPPGPRWNPTKKERFDGPERRKIVFRPSKGTRNLFTS
jgi:nucleoid DNA-binding protein